LPEVSTAILDKKLGNVEATGADCVVACDAGCLMQMRGGLARRRQRHVGAAGMLPRKAPRRLAMPDRDDSRGFHAPILAKAEARRQKAMDQQAISSGSGC